MSTMDGKDLARQLVSPNGWVRDTAQRLLVQKGDPESVPWLEKLASDKRFPKAQVHALWTLEGMGKLRFQTIIAAATNSNDTKALATAARLAPACDAPAKTLPSLKRITSNPSPDIQLALALSLGEISDPGALRLLADVVAAAKKDKLIRDAALSGLKGREEKFLAMVKSQRLDPGGMQKMLADAAKKAGAAAGRAETHLVGDPLKQFQRGKQYYSKTCFACHGADGAGLVPLAPPLVKSEWVLGEAERLAHIVLNGVQGPIKVRGKLYAPPEIQPIMPGLGAAADFDDADLADILTYVRNAWGNKASTVSEEDVAKARANAKTGIYTPEELGG